MEFMFLRKEIGQSGVAGFWWEHDGDVVEVPWDLGVSLLGLRGAGFSQVEVPVVARLQDAPVEVPTVEVVTGSGGVPLGTAVEVLDWVGTDKGRAAAALVVERGRGVDARSSLVAKLERLAA